MSPPSNGPATTVVRISSTSSEVKVIGEPREDVLIEGKADVSIRGLQTTVTSRGGTTGVRVPEGADLVIGTTSGRVTIEGHLGEVAVTSTSGRVRVAHATSLDARTDNASVEVGEVTNDCRIRTTSGQVTVGGCGHADVATESGHIDLHGVRGPVQAHCVSGRVEIFLEDANDVDAETVSGRVSVSLPPGTRAHQPGSSDSTDTADDCDCTVCATSVSGRVVISSR